MATLAHTPQNGGNPPRMTQCRTCRGITHADPPAGWYQLSVQVPVEMGKNGKPFLWVGVWCSITCLAQALPELEEQERLAHQVYEPVRPGKWRA